MTTLHHKTWFELGLSLTEQQFYHAALEEWHQRETAMTDYANRDDYARLYDEIGKTYIQMANVERGLEFFVKAADLAEQTESTLLYQIHVALAYARLGQFDRAQRLYTQLIAQTEGISLSPSLQAYLHGNLAYLQARNGFYQEAITHTLVALQHFQSLGQVSYIPELYTNLGFLLIELERYDEAEDYLQKACQLYDDPLPALTELCRLYLVRHKYAESAAYAQQALNLIWSSFINFEKEEIARLCHLFGRLAYHYGERQVALRLVEKAQLLFGQLGLWHEWNRVQSIMDEWEFQELVPLFAVDKHQTQQLTQFVLLLDAMHAQEIIHDRFSALLDTRVLYARALAEAMGISAEDEQLLVYACRFADYGLSALEPEVALDPGRSQQAMKQYRTHPVLSVKMLAEMNIPGKVQRIILQHHEQFDGNGYPYGKAGLEIEPLARALAIADTYATGVILSEQSHSEVIASLLARQTEFDPNMVRVFVSLFK